MKKVLKIIAGFLIGIVLGIFLSREKHAVGVYKRVEAKRKKDIMYSIKLKRDVDEEIKKMSKEIKDESIENIANYFFNVFGRKPKGS